MKKTEAIRGVKVYYPNGKTFECQTGQEKDGWITTRINFSVSDLAIQQKHADSEDTRSVRFFNIPFKVCDLTRNVKDTNNE